MTWNSPTFRYLLATFAFFLASWGSLADAAQPELEQKLEDAILDAAPWRDARVEIQEIRVIGKAPRGELRVELRDRRRLSGNVRAKLIGDDRTSWITADVEVYVPVVVATTDHRRGDRVDGVDVEERRLSKLPRHFFSDPLDVDGVVARRTIRAGSVLAERDVEQPLAVKRNQLVTLVVRRGAVVVTARGVALQNARVGEVVRIRNMASKAVTEAVAVRPGTVEVP